jgi:hypothetical protein
MVTRKEITAAATRRGLSVAIKFTGPFFKVTARRISTRSGGGGGGGGGDASWSPTDAGDAESDMDVIGEHDGFIAPPPFGICHMDTMR